MSNNFGGKLIGIGVGPGDPELLTIKAIKALESADVVAFHAKPQGESTAYEIVKEHIKSHQHLELLEYPVTTGITEHPGGYAGAMAEFYHQASQRLSQHLSEGKTVAVLALGDPMLYSSYQHLHRVLAQDYAAEIVPGIPSITAAADYLGLALAEEKEILSIIPGTCSREEITQALSQCQSAVIMKLGRTFNKVKAAMIQAGVAQRAYVVVRVGMAGQKHIPLLDAQEKDVPYFSVAVVPSLEAQKDDIVTENITQRRGEVVVLGLGPGASEWTTPEATEELAYATDLIGYTTYINRVPKIPGQRRHASDNKVEAERAAMALDLAKRGRRVAVVSSGDPGVFAMAAAVLETADDPQWADVPVRIVPGMTAAQAVAARVGAPLGHDFGMISLSDRLKPFSVIEKRIHALAQADMAFAVYNPASRERREQVTRLRDIVRRYQQPHTPVIVARAVGSAEENITITDLEHFDPSIVDMRTMIIIGASTTRTYRAHDTTRVFTSRRYPA
ncbi:precorrin-3B C(17)-methyltransferase [Corynebacterium sp. sy017]|uniref:precorrin-3B C(17)-methyltransferase n=1 Tax=unclassified Corynebacterium TaxID=2624378 RepID=UPI0011848286|nr:precorrin-3B C(17)-methyltransferase [Corynebacterium sp. SY003]MBP3087596.1 precorrin-3B C(17)-methyltransferase [Corynebacterium sp. sy017]TSD92166.1 precorrin-3B C(17)-methyltransferase [Corynebacterium sp. SY003]